MQTTHVELIKTVNVTSIGDPRLAAVQQGGDDYSLDIHTFFQVVRKN